MSSLIDYKKAYLTIYFEIAYWNKVYTNQSGNKDNCCFFIRF